MVVCGLRTSIVVVVVVVVYNDVKCLFAKMIKMIQVCSEICLEACSSRSGGTCDGCEWCETDLERVKRWQE